MFLLTAHSASAGLGYCRKHPERSGCTPPPPSQTVTIDASAYPTLKAVTSFVATTFQWRQCDATGANCADISGATSSTYTVPSTFSGSLRVVADGVTSGAWTPSGSPAGGPSGYYFKQSFEGSIAPATFSSFGGGGGPSNTGSMSYITGLAGQGLRVSTAATSITSGSQGASVFLGASNAFSAYSGSGTAGVHQDTWYSIWFRAPTGWHVPNDTGNWIWEWHDDTTSINELNAAGKPSVSCAIGAYGRVNPPTWLFQLNGGPTSNPNYSGRVATSIPINTNIWYHLLAHFVWDIDPAVGKAQIYVSADGGATWQTIVDQTRATLFQRSDGSWSYNTHGFYTYHLVANYNIDQDFDEWYIGPTRASVGG